MNKNIKGLLFTSVMTFVLMSIFSCGGAGLEGGYYEDSAGPAEIHTEREIFGDDVKIYGFYQGCPVWYYYNGFYNIGAYYHHNNEKRFRITQEAQRNFDDKISNFQIEGDFAVWYYYDGFYNVGAYFYKNLNTNSSINRITQEAQRNWDDKISNFEIQNGQALWHYYDGRYKEGTWHTKYLN